MTDNFFNYLIVASQIVERRKPSARFNMMQELDQVQVTMAEDPALTLVMSFNEGQDAHVRIYRGPRYGLVINSQVPEITGQSHAPYYILDPLAAEVQLWAERPDLPATAFAQVALEYLAEINQLRSRLTASK